MKKSCVIFDLDGTLCELKPESRKNLHTGNEKPILEMLEEPEKEWLLLGYDPGYPDMTKRKVPRYYNRLAGGK